jgi:uncharacterized protein YndB with AHSA1/START domain
VTDPAQIAAWFTDASPLGAVGDPYRLDFGDGSLVEGVVRELDPGRSFAYTWAWSSAEGRADAGAVGRAGGAGAGDGAGGSGGAGGRPGATLVRWIVEPLPWGGSRITLVHEAWDEAGLDAGARDEHAAYWDDYLKALAEYLADSPPAG